MIPNPAASVFAALQPQAVWRHFATLCAIPRPSKHEAALVAHLEAWAGNRGIATRVDAAGNLLLSRPATPGRENAPGIILQGHLDMVCQQTSGHAHDFYHDPIQPEVEDGWLMARHTTLGADNGVGVALALAALEDDRLSHGPLEVLLTVDEEAGMGGAHGLEAGTLRGRILLNLDTEEWGAFYLGCAGGVTVEATLPVAATSTPADWQGGELRVDGLLGGHSGIDIHLPRAHASRVLLATVLQLRGPHHFEVATLAGGDAINALPRRAGALLALPPGEFPTLANAVQQAETGLRQQWREEPGLRLSLTPAPRPERVLAQWPEHFTALCALPYGVAAMSADFPGVVETSNNLAPLDISSSGIRASFHVRSLRDATRDELAARIIRQIEQTGGTAEALGAYPGWTPDPDSPLLCRCLSIHQQEFGSRPRLEVIHAGLECGLFARSHPQLAMLSFGPDIRGAHAPGERVEIASVGHCWRLLVRLLDQLSIV
ncbi:MAG: beta-Ala-His dipeptidase [Zoogloeaceae bacterium]|jgi:dipeptidase D|nr:beta-Ala-His dipeptidase [Zoogloeaceae bacterium]